MSRGKLQINPLTGKFELIGNSGSGVGSTVVFYRECNVYDESWLKVDEMYSNVNGSNNKFANSQITKVSVRNNKTTTFDLEIYEHDGNLAGLTLLDTLSVNSDDQLFTLTQALTENKQLATKVTNLTGDRPSNLKVEVLIEAQ